MLIAMNIGLISTSDRASKGIYEDKGIPALKEWLSAAIINPIEYHTALVPDEVDKIKRALIDLSDNKNCALIFTTGGTGPAPRDVTPEATRLVGDKELPGFGELMRQISLHFVPTAILSRQTAVVRGSTLIVNLPGQPRAIKETLEGLPGRVTGLMAAIPYAVDLINGPIIETREEIVKAYRPKVSPQK